MFSLTVDDEIELALPEEHHAQALFALIDANRAFLRRWLGWVDGVTNAEHSLEFIRTSRRQFAQNRGFAAGVFYKGRLVGVVGTQTIDWTNRAVELGYWLGRDFQGKGIITRACRAVVAYAFAELKLNRLSIRCATGNRRSCAIPRRLDFTHEGVLRQAEWLYDHYVDHHVYSLLASEWQQRNKQAS